VNIGAEGKPENNQLDRWWKKQQEEQLFIPQNLTDFFASECPKAAFEKGLQIFNHHLTR
jgi:hypothetical protein